MKMVYTLVVPPLAGTDAVVTAPFLYDNNTFCAQFANLGFEGFYHPVPGKDNRFIYEDKQYPKEACNDPTYCNTILSLSSNQNCKTVFSF
jgi:hypothetical protein